jgi:chromate transporter
VFTTATFIGYVLRGGAGAAVATVAIFAPSFALVWLLAPLLRRLAQSHLLRGFLDGISASSLGLMAAAAVALGWQVDREPVAIGVSLLALLLGAGWAVNPSLLLLLGAAVGAVQQLLR